MGSLPYMKTRFGLRLRYPFRYAFAEAYFAISSIRFIICTVSRDSQPVTLAQMAESSAETSRSDLSDALRADPAALNRLVRAEIPRVERLLLRILGPRNDLADLVQTVFLELCRALPGFRGDSTFSTFVGGITIQVARRTMRPSLWLARRGAMPADAEATGNSPERSAELGERVRRSQRALEKLSADKRIAFALWAFEGMDMPAIAELTGASLSATRSRVFYAQKELRRHAATDPYLRELLGDDDGHR
jgi:RNA polymerase sigma-70 factor (ECF subfamily)